MVNERTLLGNKGLRRDSSNRGNAENISSKAFDFLKIFDKKNLINVENEIECSQVFHVGKSEEQNLQNVEKQTELCPNIGEAQNIKNEYISNVLSDNENCIGPYISKSDDSGKSIKKSKGILQALLSSQMEEGSSHSEWNDEVSVSSDIETYSSSDREEDYLQSSGESSCNPTYITRETLKKKLCVENVDDCNDTHNPNVESLNGIFEKELIICSVCKKIFKTTTQRDNHMKYSLCSGHRRKPVAKCDICGKMFCNWGKLRVHEISHTNAKPFKCTECTLCFKSEQGRSQHFKKVHQKLNSFHLCAYCGVTRESMSRMLAHEETHFLLKDSLISKPFLCHHCGKGYASRSRLSYHIRDHKKQKCSKCTAVFDKTASLQKHKEMTHGIVKTYKCKMCDKSFKSSGALRLHRISHSTVLKFFCEICDKGFKQKHHVKQHMITHSDERPIPCLECDERFKRKTHLKQHMKSAHGVGDKP